MIKPAFSLLFARQIIFLSAQFDILTEQARQQLREEGIAKEAMEVKERWVYLRFQGQNTSLPISFELEARMRVAFQQKYTALYGHWLENRPIEIEFIRLMLAERAPVESKLPHPATRPYLPTPSHFIPAWVHDTWQEVPVYRRDQLSPGAEIASFALLLDPYSTTVIELGWTLRLDAQQTAVLHYTALSDQAPVADSTQEVELALFTNRFRAIAENMGAALQRTALS
ncbi:MAG: hypothetical protein HC880_22050, partial [Bacteroidia bacterium]|nr:hypothetical protein [Bacteroidia bacterium]